jgi:protein-S-isoprenylcysteine O-methyltransferase Ste14
MKDPPRWLIGLALLLFNLAFLGITIRAWGGAAGFFAHGARVGLVVLTLALTIAASFSGFNLSPGRREDVRNRWILLAGLLYGVAFAWLPAFCDRRDLLTVDGDVARWAGLVLFAAGGLLRVVPMFVLGRRFSGLVAIQDGHALVTGGLYAVIRHPSYLGALIAGIGWALVFRSVLGLLLTSVALWLTLVRIDSEEALLSATFGEPYAAYRRRTWRLVPGVY